eukprot:Opistho-2@86071
MSSSEGQSGESSPLLGAINGSNGSLNRVAAQPSPLNPNYSGYTHAHPANPTHSSRPGLSSASSSSAAPFQPPGFKGKPVRSLSGIDLSAPDVKFTEEEFNRQVLRELRKLSQAANPREKLQFRVLIVNTVLLLASVMVLTGLLLGAKIELDSMGNKLDKMVDTMGMMYTATAQTVSQVALFDTHTTNIIYNTYAMCNVITLGTEKEKDCRNNIGTNLTKGT